MGWFTSLKSGYEKQQTDVLHRLEELEKTSVQVQTRLLKLELEAGVFRNSVLRKLQKHQLSYSSYPEEAEESENAETKRLYSGVLIPEKE